MSPCSRAGSTAGVLPVGQLDGVARAQSATKRRNSASGIRRERPMWIDDTSPRPRRWYTAPRLIARKLAAASIVSRRHPSPEIVASSSIIVTPVPSRAQACSSFGYPTPASRLSPQHARSEVRSRSADRRQRGASLSQRRTNYRRGFTTADRRQVRALDRRKGRRRSHSQPVTSARRMSSAPTRPSARCD